MESQYIDIWKYLAQWLDDEDRYCLMITCKLAKTLNLLFHEQQHYIQIFSSSFYHNFTNIIIGDIFLYMNRVHTISNITLMLPKNITMLEFCGNFEDQIDENMIPTTVTHLCFPTKYHGYEDSHLPSSIKYLSIGSYTRSTFVPSSVTHLCVNNSIILNVSSTVKYLTIVDLFGGHITASISYLKIINVNVFFNYIPLLVTHLFLKKCHLVNFDIQSSIKYLAFDDSFNIPLNNLDFRSITHLTLGKSYNRSLKNLPTTVTHIFIDESYQGNLPPHVNLSFEVPAWIDEFYF